MKKKLLPALLLVLLLAVSCNIRFDKYEKETSDWSFIKLSQHGESVTLDAGFSDGTWYECSDRQGTVIAEVAKGATFETGKIEKPAIKYYVCKTEAQTSPVFCVAYTGLPTVYVDTNGKKVDSKMTEIEATMEIYTKKGNKQDNSENITIRGRGNSSWFDCPKKSYRIHFDESQKVLDLSKSKNWPVLANYFDQSLMGNWFAGYIRNNVFKKGWNPSYEHVDLVINGEYAGNFTVSENIKISGKRVDIQSFEELEKDLNNDGKVDYKDGGFIIEIGTTRSNDMPFATTHGIPVSLSEPDVTSKEVEYYVKSIVNKVDDAIYDLSSDKYLELLDLDAFVDWYLTYEFMGVRDAAFHMSCYAYYDTADGKLHMGPCWDFDKYGESKTQWYLSSEESMWVHELLKRVEVREAIQKRWNKKKGDLKDAFKEFEDHVEKIKVSAVIDEIRWGLYSDDNFEKNTNLKLENLKGRYELLDKALNDPSYLQKE